MGHRTPILNSDASTRSIARLPWLGAMNVPHEHADTRGTSRIRHVPHHSFHRRAE